MNQANRFDGGREQKSDGKSLRGENWITPQGVARGGEGGMTWQAAKNILIFLLFPFSLPCQVDFYMEGVSGRDAL